MQTLSHSEEQVMAALWACQAPATRREIAAHLPAECRWADSTLLNFLLRLEKKSFVRCEKDKNKNLYYPLVRHTTYCAAVSQQHLQTLYGGDLRAMVRVLADTGRISYAMLNVCCAFWASIRQKIRNTTTNKPFYVCKISLRISGISCR